MLASMIGERRRLRRSGGYSSVDEAMLQRKLSDSILKQVPEDTTLGASRAVRDAATGEITTIIERKADDVAGSMGPTCLIVNTELGFTRLWAYPANWRELSDEDLLALARHPRRSQSA